MKEQYNWRSICAGLIITIAGILCILVDIFGVKTPQNLWISIGCSLIASGLVIFLNALLVERIPPNPLQEWKIEKIYTTRAEKNLESDPELEHAKYCVDAIAFGLKSFRSKQNKRVESCLKRGVNFRILTMHPESEWVKQREIEENETEGQIKHTIQDLIEWANNWNNKNYKGKIVVFGYKAMTLDFYWRVDDELYVGPYWYGVPSQQTITYKFCSDGKGFLQYTDYFETLWNNTELCSPLTQITDFKARKKK